MMTSEEMNSPVFRSKVSMNVMIPASRRSTGPLAVWIFSGRPLNVLVNVIVPALSSVPNVAMATLASDSNARSRYLAVARDADSLATAGRMLRIARRIGWLTDDGERMELVGLVDARARRS